MEFQGQQYGFSKMIKKLGIYSLAILVLFELIRMIKSKLYGEKVYILFQRLEIVNGDFENVKFMQDKIERFLTTIVQLKKDGFFANILMSIL